MADDLDVAQHVLRFWESKFAQVRPLKRGGGRRYYRPEDVELLRRIRHLLYQEGYTIKGAQKLLRQQRGRLDRERTTPRQPTDTIEDGTPVGESTQTAAAREGAADPPPSPAPDGPVPPAHDTGSGPRSGRDAAAHDPPQVDQPAAAASHDHHRTALERLRTLLIALRTDLRSAVRPDDEEGAPDR